MAAALFNAAPPPGWRARSAGTEPKGRVRPEATTVMGEVGIDISRQVPKRLDQALGPDVALVVGLCAEEICPVVPGARSLHWPLADPRPGDLDHHREIRDELRERVKQLVAEVQSEGRSDGVQ